MLVGSFNLEKSGQSSKIGKQTQVDQFIWTCARDQKVDVIFLCEIHSSRGGDYLSHLSEVHKDYSWNHFYGGHSNGYIIGLRGRIDCEDAKLSGLNRSVLRLSKNTGNYKGVLYVAHFKSGQSKLTEKQLKDTANSAQEFGHPWAITGDMNWDISKSGELIGMNPWDSHDCWPDEDSTQAKGGKLDWVLHHDNVNVEHFQLDAKFYDMSGPDHRPLLFELTTK